MHLNEVKENKKNGVRLLNLGFELGIPGMIRKYELGFCRHSFATEGGERSFPTTSWEE